MWLDVYLYCTVYCQKEGQDQHLLRNCYLSFFASLFADRHGCIYNMTEDSIPSSFILSLYSGYNKLLLDSNLLSTYTPMIQLNALEKQVVKEASQPIHTLVFLPFANDFQLYAIPTNLSIPPFPKKEEKVKEIEVSCNLQSIYDTIHKAEHILNQSRISEKERKLIPTERSLYMMQNSYTFIDNRCPSVLLPYLYNHFHKKQSFDVFCSSLLIPSDKPSKEELLKSDVLIRAYFEERENSEESDTLPVELFNDGEVNNDEEIDIEIEEIEEIEKNKKTQFITFPSISAPSSTDTLDEDIVSFINQIPGYGTFSIVCKNTNFLWYGLPRLIVTIL